MSRSPSSAFNTALAAAHLSQVIFVELQFKTATVRVCTREHDVSWNGQTWLGRGRVGSIAPLEEGAQLEARSIEMTLGGIPGDMLAVALDPSEYKNREVRLWFGLFDTSSAAGYAVVADPVGPFIYKMDSLKFELGEAATIRMTAHSRMEDWKRPRIRRYNDQDQRIDYPDDRFFEFTEQMVNLEILW